MNEKTTAVDRQIGLGGRGIASLTPRELASAARASQARVPDFFIVGHAKSGTTALYEMLRRHPQIYMPDVKEPQYFERDSIQPAKLRGRRWTTLDQTGTSPQTFDDYLSLFDAARPDQQVGEASPQYIWSQTAAKRIADVQPAARIIAILREPVSFLRSLHLEALQNRRETEESFRRVMALEEARRQGRHIPRHLTWQRVSAERDPLFPHFHSVRVKYVEQLRRYRAVFPPEQMLVLIYDDFRLDNEATVRTVLRFLDVDDTHPIEVTAANPTVRVRSQSLDRILGAVSTGGGPVSHAVKKGFKMFMPSQRLRRYALRVARSHIVYGQPRPPDEGMTAELRQRFKPEVVALSEHLDRDLVSLWGYDHLG
jgi:Sulfotransferase family